MYFTPEYSLAAHTHTNSIGPRIVSLNTSFSEEAFAAVPHHFSNQMSLGLGQRF